MRALLLALTLLTACQPVAHSTEEPLRDALAMASPAPTPEAGAHVAFGDTRIPVEVADTYETRKQGLSGRPSLAAGTGLVLWWPAPTVAKIWMPDMRFAIDVVFVRDGEVVFIERDARPCEPGGPCPTFGPDTPVDYVLEVPAGSVAAWGLAVGDAMALSR